MEIERGTLLRLVHRHVLEHDGDTLEQTRACLAAIGYLFLHASTPVVSDGASRVDDATAQLLCALGDGFIREAVSELPDRQEETR